MAGFQEVYGSSMTLALGNSRLDVFDASPAPQAPRQEQAVGGSIYPRPHAFTFAKHIPGDLKEYGQSLFHRESLLPIGLVVASTGLLLWKDQWLVDKAHQLGDTLHITHTNHQKQLFGAHVLGEDFGFDGPYDSGSALYYIGDGWVDLFIAGGFLTKGWIGSDNRALATSSEIAESVLASGFIVQILKHVTGRESPFVATESAGRWRWFPNQVDYAKNVPHYDAFPTGHIAAGMATVTVISENYSEFHWIRPLGYTLLGILGFQMMNNGVHWASDYPLGIALGYGFGRIAARNGRTSVSSEKATKVHFAPRMVAGGGEMVAQVKF